MKLNLFKMKHHALSVWLQVIIIDDLLFIYYVSQLKN